MSTFVEVSVRPPPPIRSWVTGLGLVSLALGIAELLAPASVSRATGTRPSDALLRLHGLRETTGGLGLLVASNPMPWLWARGAGDLIDLATVFHGRPSPRARARRNRALAMLVGVTAIDLVTALAAQPQKRAEAAPDIGDAEQDELPDMPGRVGHAESETLRSASERTPPLHIEDSNAQTT